jgi:acyl carrier protein
MNSESNPTDNDILHVIREAMTDVANQDKFQNVSMTTRLSSLGFDSVAAMEVAAYVEDKLGLLLPDDRISQAVSVSDLVTLIRGSLAGAR